MKSYKKAKFGIRQHRLGSAAVTNNPKIVVTEHNKALFLIPLHVNCGHSRTSEMPSGHWSLDCWKVGRSQGRGGGGQWLLKFSPRSDSHHFHSYSMGQSKAWNRSYYQGKQGSAPLTCTLKLRDHMFETCWNDLHRAPSSNMCWCLIQYLVEIHNKD